ncbi:hypothetical protein J5N97_001950 [Dioscorea zingiberensis]|uniref:Uncharacterized protein n=1 Tax=Dioscorea zingiberensis TaxID=325984 RepID=A0A9D5BT57_9LILI|nr:hypothetical protein J5N97_001950 [Dioscorea zingiberensis]
MVSSFTVLLNLFTHDPLLIPNPIVGSSHAAFDLLTELFCFNWMLPWGSHKRLLGDKIKVDGVHRNAALEAHAGTINCTSMLLVIHKNLARGFSSPFLNLQSCHSKGNK